MKDFKYSKEEIVKKTSGNLSESEKTFSDLPQNIVVTESQFERLMEQCLGGGPVGFANLDGMGMKPEGFGDEAIEDDTIVLNIEEEDELNEIVNEAYSLINEAIKTEKITLLEQGQYNRDPGVAAGEGVENVINHVKKAWEYIKDPSTREKLENSIVKLSNFMTKTAELMAAGRDMRSPRADSAILKDMPYPEHEEGFEHAMDDEEWEEEMEEGKKAKPDYLDLDGDGNKEEPMKKAAKEKMSESVEKEIKLMSEQWQRVVGNAVGTAFGTALANKASDKMGLGEMDNESMVPGEFEVTETMVDDGSDEEMGEDYKTIDHSDRSKFDGRASEVVGDYSNIEDQRDMEEELGSEAEEIEGEEEAAGLEPGMSGFDDGMTTN